MQDGVNILAVNYGSVGGCTYPRPVKMVSYLVLKSYLWVLYHLYVINKS